MALPTTYNTGTATIAANDTAVTGQNTTWSTSGIQAGDMFMAAGLSVPIASVNSNTSITLADPWPGAARNTASYRIAFTPDAQRVLASTRAVLDALTNGVLYAIAGLATAADKIAYFTGAGTAALASFTAYARSLLASTDAAGARSVLQLGSAALLNAGTSGAVIGRLDTANTWSATQTVSLLQIDNTVSNNKTIRFQTSGSTRWGLYAEGANESGGNAGANLIITRFTDAGALIDSPFSIIRSTGIVTLSQGLGFTGSAAATSRANMGLGTAATYNVGTSGAAVATYSTKGSWNGEQILNQTGRTWHAILTMIADVGNSSSTYANLIYGARADGSAEGSKRWALQLGNSSPETGSNAGADLIISRYADNGNWISDALKITRQSGIASFSAAPQLPSFTVSTLPSAAANPQGIAYVSNGTSNKRIAVSDGSSWRFPDGAVVS